MTIILPRLNRQTGFVMRPVSSGRVARSGVGGAALPMTNLDDHWAIEIDVGVLGAECGRELLADIVRGGGEPLRVHIPQIGINTGAPGNPKVKGAGQNGSSLILDGFTPHHVIRKGWFMTVEHAVFPSVHIVTAEAAADASSEATVSFWPGLRTIPADNTEIEIADPWIQGLVDEGGDHETGLLKALTLGKFVIEERG